MPEYGDLTPIGDGPQVYVHAPTHCPAGHLLRSNVHISVVHCPCSPKGTHHAWACRTCWTVTYGPPHDGRPLHDHDILRGHRHP